MNNNNASAELTIFTSTNLLVDSFDEQLKTVLGADLENFKSGNSTTPATLPLTR